MARRKNIILLQLGIAAIATSSLIGVVSCSEKNKTNTTKQNLIELIKTEFEAREFGFENQTAQEIKSQNIINQGWIYSNKDKIFKESNFNQDDIKNLNIEIKNNYNLSISFEIKNNPYNFQITNFKTEQNLIEQFEAREFGFENQTAQEIKSQNIINQEWIYSNKDKIFKESNFNQDDIKNLNIEIKNNYNLLISFEIKNNLYNFQIANFKIEQNLIKLIKTEFEAREFGFENQTAQEIKSQNIINQGWIYSNKDKIFKESNFNQDDIKNLNIEIKNNYNLSISFEIKNNPYNFQITNFKIEQSNDEIEKYKQLIKEIKEVIKLKKTKHVYYDVSYFDYNQITTDNFLNLDYEIQKKFIDFNWDELNEKFKNNALWTEEKGNKVKIDYTCEKNQENQRQIDFQVEIIVGTERETILINQFSDFLDPNENKVENPEKYEELANEIAKVINLIPKTNSDYDHQQITVEEYVNKTFDEQQKYFYINQDELATKFQQNILFNNALFDEFEISPNFEFDINNPKSLKFDIYIIVSNEVVDGIFPKNIQSVKKVEKTIDTFKEPFETISGLDKEEIKDLITPQGATSYKGKLERFRMQDIKISSENNYIDLNRNMTWNDFKKEMMYQVRFALYQMFSDNFNEINYYTHNERENRSLTATAVGIIKEKRNDVSYYFQYLGSPHKQKTNVETGDRIEISITYSGNGENDWKPTMVSTSEGIINLGDLNWSFKNSCDNLNDPNDPLYLNKPFLSFFPRAQFVIKKNGKDLYNQTNNQYVVYSFIWKRRRYIG